MSDTAQTIPLFLSAHDVSKFIRRVHPVTLRRALAAGKIRGQRHGTKIYYERESLIAWMSGNDPSPSPERPAPPKRRRGRPRKEAK